MALIRGRYARVVRKHKLVIVVFLAVILSVAIYAYDRELFHKNVELLFGPILDRVIEAVTESHGEEA
jgi:hypothetical protein